MDVNALIARCDVNLDACVMALVGELRHEFKSDDHPTFRKYFPEAPGKVIRIGLESEIQRTKKFVAVADETGASKPVRAALARIAAAEARGTEALASREAAYMAVARASLKVQAWKEDANAARRSLHNALEAHAIAHGLPGDYADEFFPPSNRAKKPVARKPKKGNGGASPARAPRAARHDRHPLMPVFQPRLLVETLEKHGVRYVLIGGMAGTLLGSPLVTQDADICPDRSADNLERLARALRELHARIRTESVEDGLPFACDEKFFAQVASVNLTTDVGSVDIAFIPSGTNGYADLAQRQVVIPVYGIDVAVASLEDIIRSKTAADRPKDRAALPVLHEVLRQTRARDGEQ